MNLFIQLHNITVIKIEHWVVDSSRYHIHKLVKVSLHCSIWDGKNNDRLNIKLSWAKVVTSNVGVFQNPFSPECKNL